MVFLTDGAVGNEDALFALIRARLGDRRLYTIGIGPAPNAWFMQKAAQEGRGTYTFIGDVRETAAKMTALFRKLEARSSPTSPSSGRRRRRRGRRACRISSPASRCR